jgi:hypothetical protein
MQLLLYFVAGSTFLTAFLLGFEAVRVFNSRGMDKKTSEGLQALGFAIVQAIGVVFIGLQVVLIARHSNVVPGSDGAGFSIELGIAGAILLATFSLWNRRRRRKPAGS